MFYGFVVMMFIVIGLVIVFCIGVLFGDFVGVFFFGFGDFGLDFFVVFFLILFWVFIESYGFFIVSIRDVVKE